MNNGQQLFHDAAAMSSALRQFDSTPWPWMGFHWRNLKEPLRSLAEALAHYGSESGGRFRNPFSNATFTKLKIESKLRDLNERIYRGSVSQAELIDVIEEFFSELRHSSLRMSKQMERELQKRDRNRDTLCFPLATLEENLESIVRLNVATALKLETAGELK